MTERRNRTRGHWWTPDGWYSGEVEYDTHVRALHASGSGPHPAPTFLPAPVDLHVHGGGGHDAMLGEPAIRGMLATHAHHGTGSLLATSVTAAFTDIDRFVDAVARVMQQPDVGSATLLGAHLEGPFINPDKLGAQPPCSAALNLEQLERWFRSGVIRVVTYAPELDPKDAVPALCARYRVKAQIGHTLCSWARAQSAIRAGAGVTHLYNAMSAVAARAGGAAAATLAFSYYAEIITDGVHVDEAAFTAARRAVPCLYSVTDATAAAGMPDGRYRLGSQEVVKRGEAVRLANGALAGSCLTQRQSIEVLRQWGLEWHAIGWLTAGHPARWIGAETVGRIEPGARAHWLEIEGDTVVARWLDGVRHDW